MREIPQRRLRRLPPPEESRSEYSYTSEPDEVALGEYWKILVKHRRMILLLFFIVFGAGAYFALSATVLYTASATIKIEPQNPQVTGVVELQPLELRGEYDYYQTQFALLGGRPLAARVISELGLESNKAFTSAEVISPNPVDHIKSWIFPVVRFFTSFIAPLLRSKSVPGESQTLDPTGSSGKLPIELTVAPSLIDQYLGFIFVSPRKNTRLVNVDFTTPDPTLSQALANAHVRAFMQTSLESRFSLTKEARDFLDQKKSELRQRLEKAEAALNAFRRAHGVLSVEKGENIVVDRLVDVNKQLTAARSQRIEAESLYRTVEKRTNQDLAQIMTQGLVQQLKTNIATLEAEKARLGGVFKPEHPKIQELNQQIAAARQAFNNEIANVVRGIKSSYAAALAKEQGLQAEADKQQSDALRLREVGVDYTLLQEEVNANRTLYETLLKRLSETNVSNDLAVSNLQIVEMAGKPLSPSGPNVPLFLMVSMFSGLLLGVGAAFLREFFDSNLGTPDEVWRSVGLGTLGVVPHLKHLQPRKLIGRQSHPSLDARAPAKELTISHGPGSIMSESYRAIRTALLLSQADKPPQVVLFTSPSPGEGKTVSSINLAIALAHDGHSVLLIDGDMRMGCCHSRFGLRNNRGLSNVLTGGLALQDGIQPTPVSGLSLLSRGVLPPNPSELLGSRKMKEILDDLRQTFDFILIDSPPVMGISDAAILSVVADGVLLVFNSQSTSTAYAQKTVERLDMVHARLLGVILNAVNLDDPHYSYYRSYSTYYQMPNGNKSPGEAHEDAMREPYEPVERSSKILDAEAFRRASEKLNEARGETRNNNPGNSGGMNWLNSSASTPGMGMTDSFESLSRASIGGLDKPANYGRTHSSRVVPEKFMNRLIDVLMDSIGPVAPLVVRDHIATLGETPDAFPHSRIDELVESIAPEILHGELRSRFRRKISEEIRDLARD